MFTGHPSVTVSMARNIGKWAKGRGLSTEYYFPNHMWKPYTIHYMHHSANFSLGHYCPAEKLWTGIPWSFQALLQLVLPRFDPTIPTSQVGEITKYSTRWPIASNRSASLAKNKKALAGEGSRNVTSAQISVSNWHRLFFRPFLILLKAYFYFQTHLCLYSLGTRTHNQTALS